MSRNACVRDPAMRAFEKVAETKQREALEECKALCDSIVEDCRNTLAEQGQELDLEPHPDLEKIDFVDQTRRVNVSTDRPLNAAALAELQKIYAAEGHFLNTVQRTFMDLRLHFGQDGPDSGLGEWITPEEEVKFVQALRARVRE